MSNIVNIVLFGIGNTGSALINKVIKNSTHNTAKNIPELRFPVITNSSVAFFEKEGVSYAWEANFITFAIPFKLEDVIEYAIYNNLENLVAVDATASAALVAEYSELIKNGFGIVSINNSLSFLPESFEKGIKFLAQSRGLAYKFIDPISGDKNIAANLMYEAIIEVAGKQKNLVF